MTTPGRLRPWHLVLLLALLLPSGLALRRLAAWIDYRWLLAYGVGVSLATYALYATDKDSAADPASHWRAPETLLHAFELAGGWPGAYLAQRLLRHKCSKLRYQLVYWLIVVLHVYLAVDFLLGWRWARGLVGWIVHPGGRAG